MYDTSKIRDEKFTILTPGSTKRGSIDRVVDYGHCAVGIPRSPYHSGAEWDTDGSGPARTHDTVHHEHSQAMS